jgi:hypothetical protein
MNLYSEEREHMLEHYLITIDIPPAGSVHTYLMTRDRKDVERVAAKMMDIVEQDLGLRVLGIILCTTLGDGSAVVREIIGKENLEAQRNFEAAANFHCTMFMLRADNPDNRRLMELH